MSFQEELAQIMAKSSNVVFTQEELDRFTKTIKEICRDRAERNLNWAYISCKDINNSTTIPGENQQILQLFKDLGLEVEFLSAQNIYSVWW